MTLTRSQAEALVMRIQSDFLDTPDLRLTISQAERRFGIAGAICEAVLRALADARVLTVKAEGIFERFYPRQTPWGTAYSAIQYQS